VLRLLREMPKLEVSKPDPSLSVVRVGISLWQPDSSYEHLPAPPPQCAVCGSTHFDDGDRLSAQLMPKLDYGEKGFEYLMRVWVHGACFESCVETNEPDPVPW
jgi:hypothetical protein